MTLADEITESALLHGEFVLRSGATASEYFDKYQFESEPRLLVQLARKMAAFVPPDTEVLAGLELGGVPLAVAIGLHAGLRTCFVRKARKTYGTCRIAEGAAVRGRRVCVVEDVVTTGGQILESVHELRQEGAIVTRVCCAILRSTTVPEGLTHAGLDVAPLFRVGRDYQLVENLADGPAARAMP